LGINFFGAFPEVGYEGMEFEHRRLAAFLEELHEAARQGESMLVMSDLLKRLLEYARAHFENEEALMRDSQYQVTAAHVEDHRRINSEIRELIERSHVGKAVFSCDAVLILRDWMSEHIANFDTPLADYLQSRRPQ